MIPTNISSEISQCLNTHYQVKYLFVYNNNNIEIESFIARRDLYILRDLFYPSGYGIGMKKRSPMIEQFNACIKDVLYFGLFDEWLKRSIRVNKPNKKVVYKKGEDEDENIALSMHHLEGLYTILGMGYALGLIPFIFERLKYSIAF